MRTKRLMPHRPIDVATLVLAGLVILPMREAMNAFPFNPPTWSLFFELVINAVYALAVRKLSDRVIVAIMAVSGLAIAGFSLSQALDAGWTWKSFPFGALRVTYSFFAGAPDLRASAGVRHARWPPRARGSRASRSPSACLYSVYDSSSIIQRF